MAPTTVGATQLIEEYLTATRHMPLERIARIAGVRPAIVDSWRCSPRKQIRVATRLRLTAYLEGHASAAEPRPG